MATRLSRGLVIGSLLGLVCPSGWSFAYVSDAEVYAPLSYAYFVPPNVGGSYLDPAFGTAITRISDARATPNAADTGTLPFITPEYATVSPFNGDDSLLLLQHVSYFALYDGQGRYLRDLPFEINASSEPRWSRRDRETLYFISGNALKRYDVTTGATTVVRTFSEYSRVSGLGEEDLSEDGAHFALAADGGEIFVYDLDGRRKGKVLKTAGLGSFNDLLITPDNNVIVGWLAQGTGRYQGVELYDGDMNFLRQVSPALGHMDVGRDTDGDEVLLLSTAADLFGRCDNGVAKVRLSSGQWTCLISFDWDLALHVSAPDGNGWCVVSTYGAGDPSLPGGWRRSTSEILEVRLDGSEVRRLAHHRSRPYSAYWWQPRATVSRDGRKLAYGSNYGLQAILGYPPDYTDAYLIDLDAIAPSPAGSQRWAAARFEEVDPPVTYSGSWYPHLSAQHSGGSAVLAVDPGSGAALAFTGTAVRWIGFRDEWSGIARVSVDGAPQAEIDTYASPAEAQALVDTLDGLAPGPHVLTIEPSGNKNAASRGGWIWIDAFDVVLRVEQDQPAVGFSGSWSTEIAPWHSGGSAARTSTAGDQVIFTFAGTAVSWIAYRDSSCGTARVAIDGIPRAEIDTYAPTLQPQALMYTLSGLAPGVHTLTLEATGTGNLSSEGAWVWVDGFEVPPS